MAKKPKPDPDPAALNYEQAIEALEEIVERIEGGEIGLAESMEAYERGVKLIARCRSVLNEAEQKISELDLGLNEGGSSAASDRTD
ncbi:MAG: exodeoxyribonuclease VII small subunit [Phycisphaerales bacterium]